MNGDAIVWMAGARWQGVPGSERRLVEQLSAMRPVLWVEPPTSILWRGRTRRPRRGLTELPNGAKLLSVTSAPGLTRVGGRDVARVITARAVRSALVHCGWRVQSTVVASPLGHFPPGVGGARVLYATDDWLAGAQQMGLSRRAVSKSIARTARAADVLLAVSSPVLEDLERLRRTGLRGCRTSVLPNGAPVVPVMPGPREPVAALVGQLNERLDLSVLDALVRHGVQVRVMGPRTTAPHDFDVALDEFLDSPTVQWLGPLDQPDLHRELGRVSLGLTPYANSAFNRASSPLKTLEYLAAGIPVVTTDLPAARELHTRHVHVSQTAEAFAAKAALLAKQTPTVDQEEDCRAFAATHGWAARAQRFLEITAGGSDDQTARSSTRTTGT